MGKIFGQKEVTEIEEQPTAVVKKKRNFAFLKGKEKSVKINLEKKMVKEFDGPFRLIKHKVTGKEFNDFVLDTQNTLIQMKQDIMLFSDRVDGVGSDLEKVDLRHNKVSEATVQTLNYAVNEMEEYKKSIRMYQIISVIAVLAAVIELILFIVK